MENVIQQLVSYAEQLIPRGMDFLLSIAVGILVFAVGSKLIKKLLKKHKYPPEGMEDAVQTVMTQCELWTDNVMEV